ncbi:MAG TPA: anaerobic ribonucleoside-triphosphate reductase, partial [Halanaerobiales bacterium]|nr:anaerobic ribonucleoside-triphosphate reductase [Halanaerobiales bacterium]
MQIKFAKKRNGEKVKFKKEKIEKAVLKAARAVDVESEIIEKEITREVISYLEIFYKNGGIPEVEQIQDLVEKVLIEKGYAEVAKAYILYREQHKKIRDTKNLFDDAINKMDEYLSRSNWKVNENSNMGYSLQGLNNFISSEITSQYWLQEIYPKEIREKHKNGDFHIHDLGNLSVYCCGWDLQDLLLKGFRGVKSKIESKPPKHFKAALGQIVNFFYTLQGEAAGAQAFSNFDTYLAPFIRYDDLSYKEVKQAVQEFMFNINVPTRVGFQCLSEDTEILTPSGWKKYHELDQGDIIKTFNVEKGFIENKEIKKIFRRKYKGKMFNIKNRIQDQLISPGHRMVRRIFSSQNYKLEEVEDVNKLKSPQIIPIAADNNIKEIDLNDEEIKLIAWIISEGSLESKGNWKRITIYQSKKKNKEKYNEIISLLKILNFEFNTQEGAKSLGDTVTQIRFNAETSRSLLGFFDNDKDIKSIPKQLLEMSQRQSRLFLETYIKGDGHEGCKITVSSKNILHQLQQIIVNSGYGFTVSERQSSGVGKKLLYIIKVIRHKDTYISNIKEVDYKGVIWSVNSENETVIAKRNGKVFITGNTPFTNITMDLEVPKFMKDDPVIIGGEFQGESYGEFQKEMDLLNKAFAEVMISGDAKGRMFSFPIPTYNITEEFEWDNP